MTTVDTQGAQSVKTAEDIAQLSDDHIHKLLTSALDRIFQHIDLTFDEMHQVMLIIMQGKCSNAMMGAILTGLRMKGESIDEITAAATDIGVIAEIKKASPSKGIISHNFEPATFAQQYEQAGASCLSVLTDRDYFQGDDSYLIQAQQACKLPLLRKDFMIDIYQIYQSYLLGADCILLIMACLDDAQAKELHKLSIELGMDVLIEVHTADELERALQLPRSAHNIYGINNRNLNTFEVDLQTTLDLKNTLLQALADDDKANIDKALIVTESGIHSADDIRLMMSHGIQHFLIGEQFMKTDHPGQALQSLLASVPASA